MAQILCFGDSITQGYTDDLGGWTQRMRRYLDSRYKTQYGSDIVPTHDVFNLGISGDVSSGLLNRLKQEATPRLLDKQTIIVIAIGTNDSVFRLDSDEVESSAEQFKQNIERLIAQATEITNKVVLVGLLPCDENKMQPMSWSSTGKSYSNERLAEFNQVIVNAASKHDLPVVNMFEDLLTKDPSMYLADGLHPNEEGHTIIAYNVQPIVERYLGF